MRGSHSHFLGQVFPAGYFPLVILAVVDVVAGADDVVAAAAAAP